MSISFMVLLRDKLFIINKGLETLWSSTMAKIYFILISRTNIYYILDLYLYIHIESDLTLRVLAHTDR